MGSNPIGATKPDFIAETQFSSAGANHRFGVGAQTLAQQFVVDVTEVGCGLEVTVVEVGQTRFVAVEAALDMRARYEHRPRGAVVGARRRVRRLPGVRTPNTP